MSLTPAFEIGLWNAWIFCFYHFLADVAVLSLINKEALKKIYARHAPINRKEKINYYFLNIFFWILSIYAVFVPLKLGTAWFYVGLTICLLGAIMHTASLVNYATTPLDKPVTKGVYRISRNPLYFSARLMFIGAGIASASWILLMGSVLWAIMDHPIVIAEERFCLEKYGESYREYMNKTPRYLL